MQEWSRDAAELSNGRLIRQRLNFQICVVFTELANQTNFCVQGRHIRGFPLYGVVHSRSASRETCYRKHLHH